MKAEKFENEKSDLTRDVSDLTARLVEARLTIAELEEENVSNLFFLCDLFKSKIENHFKMLEYTRCAIRQFTLQKLRKK